MKKILALAMMALLPLTAHAAESAAPAPAGAERTAATMVEDDDGYLAPNEYEVISTNGSISRSFCPYTCAMRGLETKDCKTWRSLNDPELCYVQDNRVPTNAIKWGEGSSKARGK
jgi:hypothetical protein